MSNDFFWSRVGWFANNFHVWRRNEWKLLANHLTSDQNIVILGNTYVILFLTCLSGVKTQRNQWKLMSIAVPLLFTMGQPVVILWRHTNTYYDVSLTDCPQNVSKWVTCVMSPSWSWSSLVNYRVRFMAFSLASMQENAILNLIQYVYFFSYIQYCKKNNHWLVSRMLCCSLHKVQPHYCTAQYNILSTEWRNGRDHKSKFDHPIWMNLHMSASEQSSTSRVLLGCHR